MSSEAQAEWKPGDPIGYIREAIPDFDVPPYRGERYEAMVPDTLDLQERAALAVNGLTGPTDPLADYEMYFSVFFSRNPPMMRHDWNYHCQIKFMESLPLMRTISGSDTKSEVDRAWMEMALHQLGPNGLAYTPVKGRPWAFQGAGRHVPEEAKARTDHCFDPMWCGRLLSAMLLYDKRDGGSKWREAATRLVDGLADLAVDRGRYAYYSPSPFYAVKGSTVDHGRADPLHGSIGVMWVALGLAHAYRETGYDPAVRLSGKLLRYLLEEIRYVDEAGRFVPGDPGRPGRQHFHAHTYTLQTTLEYALLANDQAYLELAQKGYEYGKASGETLVGYFAESVGTEQRENVELCEVADMIALGLRLTGAGLGDYWDDVDRWVRNTFAEGQLTLTRGDWMQRYASTLLASGPTARYETIERVIERNVGAFGFPTANDWGTYIMHCCTGNATRAIYYVWQSMLTHTDGNLRVNLLLNRPSKWADVESHIPYTGQVDVKVKQPVNLSIRLPEWVKPDEARVRVNDVDRRADWEGRYALVGAVVPGDVATMTFPIAERTNTVWIEKESYTLVRKGNDVVAIDPPGRACPLYQREHYRVNGTRWRKMDRFVSEEEITW